MKQAIIYISLLLLCNTGFAQDFTGIVKYKLSVTGSKDTNTDSMSVVFDKERVMVILYIPDSTKISEKKFIDDFKQKKSYTLDIEKRTYKLDSLNTGTRYKFINANGIGSAVNNELCMRYKTDPKSAGPVAECMGGINFRNSFIKDYSFLGFQPVIVDNRIVMDFKENLSSGSKSSITVYSIRKIENVESYFSLKGYTEVK